MDNLNDLAVKNFREYLQIPSVHPNIDYSDCVKFLNKMAKNLRLPIRVIYLTPKNPVVVITWKGKNCNLPSILLNSHMDVVPVFEKNWKYKAFAAEIADGKIYARGSQDMKCVGIQYLEAIRRLRLEGEVCLRTVHICFVPNEEIGIDGMELFVGTKEFKEMNVGVSLDEGYANETDKFNLLYGERSCWQFTIHCKGQTGHGSSFLVNTAGEKVAYILKQFYEFRNTQKILLKDSTSYKEGDVVGANCTKISGGLQDGLIPCELCLTFDFRIPSTYCFQELEEMINEWCREAGADCFIEYHEKQKAAPDTNLDESNIFWTPFKEVAKKMKLQLDIQRCVGTSDSRYLRQAGIPVFSFSPMNNTPLLMHGNDEYLGIETFLNGIGIYCGIISKLANVE